jgi:adenylate cyclase
MNPNSSRAHDFVGWLYCYSSDPDEALAHFDHSLRLSPIDDFAFRALTGQAFALFFLGRAEEAVTTARRALTANPIFTPCHRVLAAALSSTGRTDEA